MSIQIVQDGCVGYIPDFDGGKVPIKSWDILDIAMAVRQAAGRMPIPFEHGASGRLVETLDAHGLVTGLTYDPGPDNDNKAKNDVFASKFDVWKVKLAQLNLEVQMILLSRK